jgi:hypothetical protein
VDQEQIERNIAFSINQQAKFFSDIEEWKALGQRTDARLSRAIRLAVIEARREREQRRQIEAQLTAKLNILTDTQVRHEETAEVQHHHLEEKFRQLADSQAKTDETFRQYEEAAEVRRQRLDEKLQQLADSQARTDEKLDRLADGLTTFQTQVGQALTAMAQAITTTNQRVDALSNGQA